MEGSEIYMCACINACRLFINCYAKYTTNSIEIELKFIKIICTSLHKYNMLYSILFKEFQMVIELFIGTNASAPALACIRKSEVTSSNKHKPYKWTQDDFRKFLNSLPLSLSPVNQSQICTICWTSCRSEIHLWATRMRLCQNFEWFVLFHTKATKTCFKFLELSTKITNYGWTIAWFSRQTIPLKSVYNLLAHTQQSVYFWSLGEMIA